MRPSLFPTLTLATFLMLFAAATAVAIPAAQANDEVTIFRCVDGKGHLTLRDSPCNKGEQQQIRNMIRPKDAPPRPQATPVQATVPTATQYPAPQVIVVQPAQPLYECVTPDNNRYLSDTPEGNPRLVPTWVTDLPAFSVVRVHEPGQTNIQVDNRGHVSGNYSSGGYRDEIITGWPAQHWVRDACHLLPKIEACARLRDRREEVRRRFFIAQPTERTALDREERGINARLAQDCP